MSKKPTFDYRAARDRIFGIVRDEYGKVTGYLAGLAKPTERALLLALIEFAPNMEPSIAALAQMLGLTERQAQRLVKACQAKGLLQVLPRSGRRNRYQICHPHPYHKCHPKQTSKAVVGTPEMDLDPEYRERVNAASRLGFAMDAGLDRKPEDNPYGR